MTSKKGAKPVRYAGPLGSKTKIQVRVVLLPKGADFSVVQSEHETWKNDIEQQLLARLLDYFGIDPDRDDSYQQLALALARNHVPAFTFSDRPGPSPETTRRSLNKAIDLVGRVERLHRDGGTYKEALEQLEAADYFKGADLDCPGEFDDFENPRQRYQRALRLVRKHMHPSYQDLPSVRDYCLQQLQPST